MTETGKAGKQHWKEYIQFCKKHPEMITNEFESEEDDLWNSLSNRLNKLSSCRKSVTAWKKSINQWRTRVVKFSGDGETLDKHEEDLMVLIKATKPNKVFTSSEEGSFSRKLKYKLSSSSEEDFLNKASSSRRHNYSKGHKLPKRHEDVSDNHASQHPTNFDLQGQHQEMLEKLQALTINTERIAAFIERSGNKSDLAQSVPKIFKNEFVPHADATTTPSKLNIYYQNIRGLRRKKDEFKIAVTRNDYDVIVLTETFLDNSVADSDLFDTTKYTVFRTDRSEKNSNNKCGGGVLIATSKRLGAAEIKLTRSTTEEIWVSLAGCFILGAVYFPGTQLVRKYKDFFESVKSMCFSNTITKIILGDFNLSKIRWEWELNQGMLVPKNVAHGEAFLLIYRLALLGLHQRNDIKNENENILDLVYANTSELIIRKASPLLNNRVVEGCHPPLMVSLDVPYLGCEDGKRFRNSSV